jgi:adhesin transport system membrane fusion protein
MTQNILPEGAGVSDDRSSKLRRIKEAGLRFLSLVKHMFLPRRDAEYASVTLAARIERPSLFGQALVAGVFLFLVIGVIWANWAILDEVTNGEGRVIPSQQIQVVQNLEGGIVRKIEVHEGEMVSAGQILLQIDNSTFVSSLGELKAKEKGLQAAVARLQSEAHQRPLNFPPTLIAESRDIAERERSLYMARQGELQAQISILEQQVMQKQQELADLKSRELSLAKGVDLLQQQFEITKPLVDQGVVPKMEFLKLQGSLNDSTRELDSIRLTIPRAESALREANRRIEERYLGFRADAQKELTQKQTDLSAVRESIFAARDRVLRTEVRSPVRGIVKQVLVSTVGGVVRPGMDLIEVVPIDDTLLVEAKVRPQDIAFIRPNQKAIVKITAYDFSIYGGLDAKVERISADTITEKDANGKSTSYYKIVVRTGKNYLGTRDKPLPIIPGMVATVDILTGKKSVLDYMLKPVLKVRERALRER